MLYLHEYLSQSENYKFFDTSMGFLPSDTFSESNSDHLVINHMTLLLEGVEVEVVDIRHVVVEAVADERKTE